MKMFEPLDLFEIYEVYVQPGGWSQEHCHGEEVAVACLVVVVLQEEEFQDSTQLSISDHFDPEKGKIWLMTFIQVEIIRH